MDKKRILIIEDDLAFAENAARILRDLGYSVTMLTTVSKRALSQVRKENPSLVLINIRAGDKSQGIEMARSISEGLEIPVLVLVERSEIKMVKTALKRLSCGCVLKPVDERNLELALETALARHAMEKKSKDRLTKALRESEKRYQQLVDNISEGIVIQDKNGIITSANERFLAMIGYRRREIIGRPISKFLGEGWLKKEDKPGSREEEDRWRSVELAWKKKDGRRIYTILSRKPIYDPKSRFEGSVAVLADITDRREVELELRHSQEELRSLSHHIQSVREQESKRIAAEIHDVLGQQLTALKIDLSWIAGRVPPLGESGKEIQDKIGVMSDLVDKTIQSVQKISAELRPVLLDDLGLGPAIEWLAQDFENRTKIKCRVRVGCDDIDLDADWSTAIFRISQEALTNVVRHARATSVDISLGEQKGALVLKISDNGKGIKENEIYAPSSLGLIGMRERLRPFRGKLEISSAPEKGTALTVTLPLEKGMMRKLSE
jgi:two-component system sensor histidine kinase UhpB